MKDYSPEDYANCEPGWTPSALSDFVADLWESRRGIVPTASERDMAAFAVMLFCEDEQAGEALDRMRYTGGVAA